MAVDKNAGGRLSHSFPKGGIDEGEDVLTAAKREIYEEVGVKNLGLKKNLGDYERINYSEKINALIQKRIFFFLFTTSDANTHPIDQENEDPLWLEREKVADTLSFERDKEFFLKIKDEI